MSMSSATTSLFTATLERRRGRALRRAGRLALILALAAALAACSGESHDGGDRGEDTAHGSEAIVNGWAPSVASEYASIAQIDSLNDAGGFTACTGTLIDPHWVLTAKHCITPGKPGNTWVRIGNYTRSVGGEYHSVAAIRTAPYDPSYYNDVALLRLYDASAQPVTRLADPTDNAQWEVAPNQDLWAIATGWGRISPTQSTSTIRRTTVKIAYVSPASDPYWYRKIRVTQGIGYTCQGDSGGPLLVWRADGTPGVAGVLATTSCAGSGGYTRVGEGVNYGWIRAQLRASLGTLDFDGNSASDVFTARSHPEGGYQWYTSSGGAGVWDPLAFSYEPVTDLRFGDFDGDGLTDVFSASPRPQGGYQWSYSSGGAGNWAPLGWSYDPVTDLRFGDFDGDGVTDVFRATPRAGGGYQWSYSSGGTANWADLAWSYEAISDLRFGDFNGDGITDVFRATPRAAGGNQWSYSPGGAGNWAPLAWSYESITDLRFGDFDGDGVTDVFTASLRLSGGYSWYVSAGGAGSWRALAESNEPITDLRFGDFDGDGITDVFTASPRLEGGYQWFYTPRGVGPWKPLAWSYEPLTELRVGHPYDQP
jgi:hypothetical protein